MEVVVFNAGPFSTALVLPVPREWQLPFAAKVVLACMPLSPEGRGVDRPRRKQDTARAGRQPEYDRGTDDLKRKARPAVTLARRFPAIGSFEVYLRTPSGAHQARM